MRTGSTTAGYGGALLMRSKRDANSKVVRMALRPDRSKNTWREAESREKKRLLAAAFSSNQKGRDSYWTFIGPAFPQLSSLVTD